MSNPNRLKNLYATRNGAIEPWGAVNVLYKGVTEPRGKKHYNDLYFLRPGSTLWSEQLLPYGTGKFRAVIGTESVDVVAEDGTVVETIPSELFSDVEVKEMYVWPNGYLQYELSRRKHGTDEWTAAALDQAEKGEMPAFCDNLSFTKVDALLAGTVVMVVRIGYITGGERIVFTQEGERVPSTTSQPLSAMRWGKKLRFTERLRQPLPG
jgi:hypothetical protein